MTHSLRTITGYGLLLLLAGAFVVLSGLQSAHAESDKRTICHMAPGNINTQTTITVSVNALKAHMAHGDKVGVCDRDSHSSTSSHSSDMSHASSVSSSVASSVASVSSMSSMTGSSLSSATTSTGSSLSSSMSSQSSSTSSVVDDDDDSLGFAMCHDEDGTEATIYLDSFFSILAHFFHGDALGECEA